MSNNRYSNFEDDELEYDDGDLYDDLDEQYDVIESDPAIGGNTSITANTDTWSKHLDNMIEMQKADASIGTPKQQIHEHIITIFSYYLSFIFRTNE